jgi:hypothetical protein
MDQKTIDALPTNLLIDGDWETREVHIDGKLLRPEASQAVRNHSPDGFNWGYGGSGPAQLALAILLRYMTVEDANKYYQAFKFQVVASWPQSDFEIRLNLKEAIENIILIKNDA